MEIVIRSATKLLGDCKAGNLSREIKKLKEDSGSKLKEQNDQMKLRMAELQGIIKSQGAEVERLRKQNADLGSIREALSFPGDVLNRALLFDEDVRKEGHLAGQKILAVLVKYGHKMEATLGEMWKLLPEPSGQPANPPPAPSAASPSAKSKYPLLDSLIEKMKERESRKNLEAAASGEAVPVEAVPTGGVPSISTKEKGKEPEQESRAASSEPTSGVRERRRRSLPQKPCNLWN